MDPTETASPKAPPDTSDDRAIDHDRALIEAAVAATVMRNRSQAQMLDAMACFHTRRVAEVEARASAGGSSSELPGYFRLTPLQATKAEFGPLLALSDMWIEVDIDLTNDLKHWLPQLWGRCLSGRLDISRAQVVHAQLGNLTSDEDKAAYCELVQDWLDRNDDPDAPVFPMKRYQVQRAVRRICLKFPQKSEDESYAKAFKKRRVSIRDGEHGMSTLVATMAAHEAMLVDYRLTLIAKRRREEPGETRTLEQLRDDTLVDLALGRIAVSASDAQLEDPDDAGPAVGEMVKQRDLVGQWARPVISVIVPLTSLIEVSDEPALLGGSPIPADLARQIAADPNAMVYRMLVDPERGFRELSVDSYTPTAAIRREVAARDPECVFPGCTRPATICECDHREPHPVGPTCTSNLQPLCEHHHTVKHSEGFTVVRNVDGSYTWTSRFGSVFRKPAPDYPAVVWPVPDEPPAWWFEEADEPCVDDEWPDTVRELVEQLSRETHDRELAVAGAR